MSRKLFALAVILLPIAFVVPAFAEMTLAPHISYVKPENIDGTIGFGVNSDLYQFSPQLHLEGNVDYWSKSMSEIVDVKFHDIAIGGTMKYYFETSNETLKPYVLGGLGLHFFHSEFPIVLFDPILGFTDTTGSANDTKLGLDLGGGALFGTSPKTKFFGELKYRIVSDVGQFVVSAGVVFYFNK